MSSATVEGQPFILFPARYPYYTGQKAARGRGQHWVWFLAAVGIIVFLFTGWVIRNAAAVSTSVTPLASLFLIGLWLLWFITGAIAWFDMRSLRRFVRNGRILPGEITTCELSLSPEGALWLSVHYWFETPSGQKITAQAQTERYDLPPQLLPVKGTPVLISYINDEMFVLL